MKAYLRRRKGIRRFTDDILPAEIRLSIMEMTKSINSEIVSKIDKKGQSINLKQLNLTGPKTNIN